MTFVDANDWHIQYMGRVEEKNPMEYMFIYPATSATLRFKGTEIYAVIENHWQFWQNYMGYILDGVQGKFSLTEGGNEENKDIRQFLIAKDLPDCAHTVTLFKRQDACHKIYFGGFCVTDETELLPPNPLPERRIVFFGDSISAGECSEAVGYEGKPDPAHNGEYSNAWYSYAWMTARKLHAQMHDIAQGGIALLDGTGYFNAPGLLGMESVWDKMQYNPALGEVTDWGFLDFIPHVIVIAIGQNDAHPENFMRDDYHGEKAAAWRKAYRKWVEDLHDLYPDALIVLATSIMEHDKSWDDAIEDVTRALHDEKTVHFYYKRNGCGTPGHIRISEAEEMAEELSAFIEERATALGCFPAVT